MRDVKVLWINPKCKTCPMCWWTDSDMRLLAEHIANHHPGQLSAYMGSMGLNDRMQAARRWAELLRPGARLSPWERGLE